MADEMTLVKKVEAYMAAHHMTCEGDRLLVGFSGGADSLCLLILLWEMRERLGFTVQAMHVNHGIRGEEAKRDEDFAREFCREKGIPFCTVHVDVPAYAAEHHMSEEEAGRFLRYENFDRFMSEKGLTKLALAHHENDLAETMLYNMARGTGLAGLCSLKPMRDNRIRPLLCCTREEIEAEVKRRGLTFVTDSTNNDDDYTRNRLRHTVMPSLTADINGGALRHMRELSENASEILDFVTGEALKALETDCIPCREADGSEAYGSGMAYGGSMACGSKAGEALIVRPAFFDRHPAVAAEGLRIAVSRLSGTRKDFGRTHVEALMDLAMGDNGRQGHFPGGILGEKTEEGLVLSRFEAGKATGKATGKAAYGTPEAALGTPEEALDKAEITLEVPGTTEYGNWRFSAQILDVVPISIPENAYTKWLDYDRMKGTLRLRRRKPGDRLTINAAGGHKSLSDYLTDHKIPPKERDELTLLCDDIEVIWLVGHRIGAFYKVTSQTKRVLKISAELISDKA